MSTTTYVAAGILAYALYNSWQKTPKLSGHPRQTPAAMPGGEYTPGVGVSLGNEHAYRSDASNVVWKGEDIYGIEAQDVMQPDGSLRRVYGDWSTSI